MDDTPTPIPTPLNVAELAKRHGVSKRTIQRRIKRGAALGVEGPKRPGKRDMAARDKRATLPATLAPAPAATTAVATAPPIATLPAQATAARIAATAFCVAPAGTLNIWPRLHDMIAGHVDPKAVGLVAAQSVFVAIMAATPFALERPAADRRRVQAIGAMCLAMNFYLAQVSIGSIFDAQSDPRQAAIDHQRRLETDLAEARDKLGKLPAFTFTTQAQADDAQNTVNKECSKVGPKCISAREVLKDRTQTLEAARLNKKIDILSQQLRDQSAPSDAHKAPWWWPPALAMAAELAAMYGGYVLTLALVL